MNRRTRRRKEEGWLQVWLSRLRRFLTGEVWAPDLHALPTFRAFGYKFARVVYLAGRGFVRDRCLFRASALTYVTVLSIIPLLAFSFAVAKGLGAYDRMREEAIDPFLDRVLGPLEDPILEEDEPGAAGEEAPEKDPEEAAEEAAEARAEGARRLNELADADEPQDLRDVLEGVLTYVEKTPVSGLGTIGLLILIFTVIKLLSSVEQSFNEIWGVGQPRSILRKFSDYLSMVVIVPVLLVAATSANTAAQSTELVQSMRDEWGVSSLIDFYLRASSLIAVWIGFTFVYLFMPNTRTPILSALIGGIIGGSLWHLAQMAHVKFQVGVAQSNPVYSSFAAFPIFMVWLWVSWATVLVGAEVTFAHQNEPAYRQIARSRHHDQAFKELLALRAFVRITMAFLRGDEGPTAYELGQVLGVPEHSVEEVVLKLHGQRLVVLAEDDEEPGYLPARDPELIHVKQVLDAIRGTSGHPAFPPRDVIDREVDRVYDSYEGATGRSPHNRSMRELAEVAMRAVAEQADPQSEGVEAPLAAPS